MTEEMQMRYVVIGLLALVLSSGSALAQKATPAKTSPGAGPVLVVETAKGTVEIETYPQEAPKTVEHILTLAKRNFYNGQRVHRVEPGKLIQFGDPNSRDYTKEGRWGSGGSGKAIGVAEFSKKRTHGLGAVSIAYAGDPKAGDSQMFIVLQPTHPYDGKYTVFGQVISGMDVVKKIARGDVIRRISVRADAPPAK